MIGTWITQHALGARSGYSYFNTYVNPANQQVLGWVARAGVGTPYLLYYFLGDVGGGLAQSTRGTVRHAMDAVDGAVAHAGTTIGLLQTAAGTTGTAWLMDIPALTKQIQAHAALQLKRGW